MIEAPLSPPFSPASSAARSSSSAMTSASMCTKPRASPSTRRDRARFRHIELRRRTGRRPSSAGAAHGSWTPFAPGRARAVETDASSAAFVRVDNRGQKLELERHAHLPARAIGLVADVLLAVTFCNTPSRASRIMSPSSLVNTLERRGSERPCSCQPPERVRIIAGQRLARTGIRMAKIAVHAFVAPARRVVARHAGEAHARQTIDLLLRQLAEEQFGQHAVIGCSALRIHLDELGNQLVALRLRLQFATPAPLLGFRSSCYLSRTAQTFTAAPSAFSRYRYLALSLFRLASRTG